MAMSSFLVVATLLQATLLQCLRRERDHAHEGMREDDARITNTSIVAHARTSEGCRCKSEPMTSMRDWYGCEWCRTEGKCGTWSWRGRWGKCIYPSDIRYDDQDHETKREMLWNEVKRTAGKSATPRSVPKVILQIIRSSMRTTYDNYRDVMPPGRVKVIHPLGVNCKIDMVISSGSPFTGLFGPGTHKGLIRWGNAMSIDIMKRITDPIVPGIAVKFLRSGVHSANLVLLQLADSEKGNKSNFFNSSMSSHSPPPDWLMALKKFQQPTDCATMVGLSDLCSRSQDGKLVDKNIFPYEIRFHSAGRINKPGAESDAALLRQLESVPSGTVLYEVYGRESPLSSKEILIGEFKTASVCTRSLFGDNTLSFRHQRMEDDFLLRPDWVPHVKGIDYCDPKAVSKAGGSTKRWKCPGSP